MRRDQIGVAFRVVALTHVDADNRCRYGAQIDATPWGAGMFNTLGLSDAQREPRPDTSFGARRDRSFPNSKV
jgi:hypothetical protein